VDVLQDIKKIAKENGWTKIKTINAGMYSFKKFLECGSARINIFYTKKSIIKTKFTVATAINHPKQGKTQLFRRNVEIDLLEKIFINPRIHTKKGYQKKKGR
jgi:hypothetical protein